MNNKKTNILAKAHAETQTKQKRNISTDAGAGQTKDFIEDARQKLSQDYAEAKQREQGSSTFWGKVGDFGEGIMGEIADNTRAGRIFIRPLMDTPGEKAERLAGAMQRVERSHRVNQIAEARRLQLERGYNETISNHQAAVTQNLRRTLEQQPAWQGLTDKQQKRIFNSQFNQDFINSYVVSRLGLEHFVQGKDKGVLKYYAKKLGMEISQDQKTGKSFVRLPGSDETIEINHRNFTEISNALNKAATEHLATMVQLEQQTHVVPGNAKYQKVNQVLPHFNGNASAAVRYHDTWINQFSPADQRKHWMVTGLGKFFDGVNDENEKAELVNQLMFLSKKMGIKHTQDAAGNLFVIDDDGKQVPIKQFYEQEKAGDKVGIGWQKEIQRFNREAMQKAVATKNSQEMKNINLKLKRMELKKKEAENLSREKSSAGRYKIDADPRLVKQMSKNSTKILDGRTYSDEEKMKYKELAENFGILWEQNKDVYALRKFWFDEIEKLNINKEYLPFPFEKKYKAMEANRKELDELNKKSKKESKKAKTYHANIRRKATTGQNLTAAEKSNIPFGELGNR